MSLCSTTGLVYVARLTGKTPVAFLIYFDPKHMQLSFIGAAKESNVEIFKIVT